jgi:hypothetical protein
MKPLTLLIAATLVVVAAPVMAQQKQPAITLYGDASVTCQTWLSEPQNGPDHQAHQQWLLGYLSGYDMFVANNESLGSSNDGVTGYLDARYCPNHPNDTIATAGAALVDDMRSRTGYPLLRYSAPATQYSN